MSWEHLDTISTLEEMDKKLETIAKLLEKLVKLQEEK